MTSFETIRKAAAQRHGGGAALQARLPQPKTTAELRALSDDRYLSTMALRIFRAGLKHSLVDAKWPAFETAFQGFEPRRVRAMSDEAVEALLADKSLIRHGPKLRAVHRNAAAFCDLAAEKGSFGAYLADWPADDPVGLWDDIAKRFTHLGGNSGPYFLRMVGRDSFVLTDSVVTALQHWGVMDGPPKGKAGRAKAQEAFNRWVAESGLPLCQLSMTLALSCD